MHKLLNCMYRVSSPCSEPVDFGGGGGRGEAARQRQLEAVSCCCCACCARCACDACCACACFAHFQRLLAAGPLGEQARQSISSHPACCDRFVLPPHQMLDEYGLLRSRNRSYLGGRMRGVSLLHVSAQRCAIVCPLWWLP